MSKVRKVIVKTVIGNRDCIDVPEADIFDLPCKIDTGADTSSIHCDRIHLVEKDGKEHLAFRLLDKSWKQFTGKFISTDEYTEKKIKSSFGDYEFRYQVRLKITLFGKSYKSRFTLSNRSNMKYPVLLGKGFLKNRYMVDVTETDLSLKAKSDSHRNKRNTKKSGI